MSEHFLRFKRKHTLARLLKALLYGIAAGLLFGGLFLLLAKLNVIKLNPLFSIPVGVGGWLLIGLPLYFLLGRKDAQLARSLDKEFALSERVETMLAYKEESGVMLDLQRRDTEAALAQVPTKKFKIRRLWISFIALAVGVAMCTVALIQPNLQNQKPPEVVIPFSLSNMQRTGVKSLIEDVNKSEMEEPYRTNISKELERLLDVLEVTTTKPAMEEELGKTMLYVLAATSASSSMTEIANALWDTQDDYARSLAKVIDTSDWTDPDWGDFAEKYSAFTLLYGHQPTEGEEIDEAAMLTELQWKLQNSSLKMSNALKFADVPVADSLYVAIDRLLTTSEGAAMGFGPLSEWVKTQSYTDSVAELNKTFNEMDDGIYAAISTQKVNTNVGERVMTKLSDLFMVFLPAFERPDLKDGSGGSENDGEEDEDENGGGAGGGIGGGATYGSDDYVLDPLTGEYVKYGTLLAKYYALMNEKLDSETYTEAQKEAIKKYFDLLYGGIKE